MIILVRKALRGSGFPSCGQKKCPPDGRTTRRYAPTKKAASLPLFFL